MSDDGTRLQEESPGGGEWGAVLLRLLVALAVLGGAYVAAALYFQDRPPAGMTVDGVDIGSMTRDEAADHLDRELEDRLEEPVVLTVRASGGVDGAAGVDGADEVAEETLELVPAEAGLSYDVDAILEGATGLSFDPRVLWSHVSGGARSLPLQGAVDREQLAAAVERLAEDYDTEVVEGEVTLTDEGVRVVEAELGRSLDVDGTVDAVASAWPDDRRVEGRAVVAAPTLSQDEVERFTREEVDPALSEAVRVTATRGSGDDAPTATAEIAPRELVELLGTERTGDTLSLTLDEEGLMARIRQDLGQLERGPRDATVELDGTDVDVVPARSGAALQEEGLVAAVREALTAEGEDRTVEATLEAVEPGIPTEVSEAWSFSPMAEFTSVFPTGEANAARTHNLHVGVENVNGTVVMPGRQFSLGVALGDLSEEGGYREAPVIVDGRLVMGLGGGLSQISTVVFNVSWFAGVQLDAHTPHSYYISRYPAGREATLAYPIIDNVWTNDTDTPVVVRSWIEGDQIHMVFLGDRQYDVETIDGPRRDVRQPEEHVDDSPECVPQGPAEGFTITNVRILRSGGQEVSRDEFTTTYHPADEVVCTHPEAGY
ncbi:VanW family protein [Ornithinimicrobium kibberense]|jgi:vancomycin resistance protein YoaR|uniref:VanW family protein n=1 Tax=Ornithinimicrobium kibberense TaxID=282060 RepID=A0ABV5V0A8_9MICO|nr:VanW family protein [Ornithinimicrobium kibberense]